MNAPAVHRGDGSGRKVMPGKNTTHDLFPDELPTVTCPTLPDPESRRAAVLEALRRGERLTQAGALARGWGWRLAADVFALKEIHGWAIVATMISNPGGNDIAEYWLPADARQAGSIHITLSALLAFAAVCVFLLLYCVPG